MNEDWMDVDRDAFAERALGRSSGFQLVCAMLWMSFLSATLSMIALLMVPPDWTMPPDTLNGIGWTFLIMWALALVPSILLALLLLPRRQEP